jgi:DNA-binding transcriptional MerR regulator
VGLLSIGECARMSQLSPKALRLYGELGLLPPARIDPDSGYRFYAIEQLERARLVSSLRAIGVPLARIGAILDASPEQAGEHVAAFWAGLEVDHTVRRELARRLVERLDGTRSAMYEVATRTIAERHLLCLERHVDGEQALWALGKEFVGLLQERPIPRVEGRAGAAFQIYHGVVSDDSDGPVEWCRPVRGEQADALATRFPELVLRIEPAHEEAFVPLGTAELSSAEWQLVSDTLRAWAAGHDDREPSDLGVRVTYLASPQPRVPGSRPDCDFAVPLRATA